MSAEPHRTVYRDHYRVPPFLVDAVRLQFDLEPTRTRVGSRLHVRRNPAAEEPALEWHLDGEALELLAVRLDGQPLSAPQMELVEGGLLLRGLPERFELEIDTRINPTDNTELSGLYLSNGVYCTQCEAQGFRRITYFPDRPDVLSTYDVIIRASREHGPVLLSNGNPVSERDIDARRIEAVWHDPHPKPSYLFALVAGDLACRRDTFTTAEGREVALAIYTQPEQVPRTEHAMRSLIASMQWDEKRFGLSYDLDVFNVVAVDDFNMGAMENKGLNVFNTKYVLADADTATDSDYLGVEAVIAHEYFHNWTGNRITCRDWFQLSLKEGLTVFRDQEFSGDLNVRALKRIEDVRLLRARQFPEDAGPMAHPIRPESYVEINNFYTLTVYEKGAEVVRMLHTLLGEAGFRRGMDLYVSRHDGTAATCDDFRLAMAEANGVDLDAFEHWYSYAGTPVVDVAENYDAASQTYTLTLRQSLPDQATAPPLVIPVRMGLVLANGEHVDLQITGEHGAPRERVLMLSEREQDFVFEQVPERPVASLLRGFSAPVHLSKTPKTSDNMVLLRHDSDPFNRWQAAQDLLSEVIVANAQRQLQGLAMSCPEPLVSAIGAVLQDSEIAPGLRAEALTLPGIETVSALDDVIELDALDQSTVYLERTLGEALADALDALRTLNQSKPFSLDPEAMGARRLHALCTRWRFAADPLQCAERVASDYRQATNMTDRLNALSVLVHARDTRVDALRTALLAEYEAQFLGDKLAMDKWFALQASSPRKSVCDDIGRLRARADFDIRNPNRARALIGAFAFNNPVQFHATDGKGYQLLADFIAEYDAINPQISARLLGALSGWRRHTSTRQDHAKAALERLLAVEGLSRDCWEIASKALTKN